VMEPSSPSLIDPSSSVVHALCIARSSSSDACGTGGTSSSLRQSLASIPGLGTVLADSIDDIWTELVDLRELVESRLNPPTDPHAIRNMAVQSPTARHSCLPTMAASSAGSELRAVLDKRRARAEGTSPTVMRTPSAAAPFTFAGVDKGDSMEPERFSIADDEPGQNVRAVETKIKSRVNTLACSELKEPPVPRRPIPPAGELAKSVNEALLATHGKIAAYKKDCSAQCKAITKNARELEEQIGEIGNDLAVLKSDLKIRLHTVARKCLDDQTRLGQQVTEQLQATVETVESLDRTVSGLRSSVDQNREQLAETSAQLVNANDELSNCDRRIGEIEDRCGSLEQGMASPGFSKLEDVQNAIRDISAAAEQNSRLNRCLHGAMQSLRTAMCDSAGSAPSTPSTELLHPTELSLIEKTLAGTSRRDKCQ